MLILIADWLPERPAGDSNNPDNRMPMGTGCGQSIHGAVAY